MNLGGKAADAETQNPCLHGLFALPFSNFHDKMTYLGGPFGVRKVRNLSASVYLALAILLVNPTEVWGGDYEKGLDLFERGDYQAALFAWQPLAEKGDANAQNALGWLYNEGKGAGLDFGQAFKWYMLAAEQGNVHAHYNLGFLHEHGNGTPRDEGAAMHWYTLAAQHGDDRAYYRLGLMYARATTTPEDSVRAYMWYHIAAAQAEDQIAAGNRNSLAAQMSPAQLQQAQNLASECVKKNYNGC